MCWVYPVLSGPEVVVMVTWPLVLGCFLRENLSVVGSPVDGKSSTPRQLLTFYP